MNHRNVRSTLIASSLIAAALASGSSDAALQGRNMDSNALTFEAYYDTVLDITWLADANMNGAMTWANAKTWAANLSFTNPLTNQTYADWRLPSVNPVNGTSFNYNFSYNGSTDAGYNITSPQSEMAHLFSVTLGNPGYFTPEGTVSGCFASSNACLDDVGPFTNFQSHHYWSGTEYAPSPGNVWIFGTNLGGQGGTIIPGELYYALAVSPGDIAAVPEAQTWAMLLAGLGLVGVAARRRRG